MEREKGWRRELGVSVLSMCRREGSVPKCRGHGWRGLDQGGLQEQGGCGGNTRAAEGSTKSE